MQCGPNPLNERGLYYLMPGEELHETPDGDETRDRTPHNNQRCTQSNARWRRDRL